MITGFHQKHEKCYSPPCTLPPSYLGNDPLRSASLPLSDPRYHHLPSRRLVALRRVRPVYSAHHVPTEPHLQFPFSALSLNIVNSYLHSVSQRLRLATRIAKKSIRTLSVPAPSCLTCYPTEVGELTSWLSIICYLLHPISSQTIVGCYAIRQDNTCAASNLVCNSIKRASFCDFSMV